jgi:histone H3/H4
MTSLCQKVRVQRSHQLSQHEKPPPTTKPTMDNPTLGPTKLTTLPAATVQKIINEVLASKAADENAQSMSFAKETRDLLIECCVEFITMISTEANEIAEKDAKKTIACEHITKALEELGFGEYVQEIMAVADQFKTSQVVRIPSTFKCWNVSNGTELTATSQSREKKQSKMEQSGMSPEELARMQEELFRSAGDKFNAPGTA